MTRRPVLAAAALVATLTTGCVPTTSDTSSGTSAGGPGDVPVLVDKPCADLVILGARGSTQAADKNLGVGTEVRLIAEATARRLHRRSDATVDVRAVPYDSDGTATVDAYTANVRRGARLARQELTSLVAACPASRFALLGFSQGAQVVHEAATDLPSGLARRVVLVGMIADPLRNPDDRIAHWAYQRVTPTHAGRLGAGPPIDPDVRAAAISLCVVGDEICNANGVAGSAPSRTHKHFYERPSSVRSTTLQLDRVLQSRGL